MNKQAYVFKYNNHEVLSNSSSGGAFSALSDYVIKNNGIVYGAIYDYGLNVAKHVRTDNYNGRNLMRGSKYIQSKLLDSYKDIFQDLQNGKTVLFTGTICQVAGLKSYLSVKGVNTDNLYTCDIICHGTASPLIWKQFLKHKSINVVDRISFRDKMLGWDKSRAIAKCNSKTVDLSEFMKLFYSHTIMRPICHECRFTNVTRLSDVTIGDFWGIKNVFPDFDYYSGVSFVMANSEKGQHFLNEVIEENSEIITSQCDVKDVIQPNFYHPTKKSIIRNRVWRDYQIKGIAYIVKEYSSNNRIIKCRVILKKIFDKLLYSKK